MIYFKKRREQTSCEKSKNTSKQWGFELLPGSQPARIFEGKWL